MVIRNFLIRIAAECIYWIHFQTLACSATRFIVFTGTSGKTLARTATVHALRTQGLTVVSPPYGYTNELGIVLAALGIESVHLLSREGLRRVWNAKPIKDTYVCIELGADWRKDIPWFLKHFAPYGVCITQTTCTQWTRSLQDIWKDKESLVAHLTEGGFISWSSENMALEKIRSLQTSSSTQRFFEFTTSSSVDGQSFTYRNSDATHTYTSPLAPLAPYREAFGSALTCLSALAIPLINPTLFLGFEHPSHRLSKTYLPSHTTLITDTYKAVPHCTEYVLTLGLTTPAKKRIVVLSEMHPLWKDEEGHYDALGEILSHFDTLYFVGSMHAFALLRKKVPLAKHLRGESAYPGLATTLREEFSPETLIVIKGAGRYHLEKLVALLRS